MRWWDWHDTDLPSDSSEEITNSKLFKVFSPSSKQQIAYTLNNTKQNNTITRNNHFTNSPKPHLITSNPTKSQFKTKKDIYHQYKTI